MKKILFLSTCVRGGGAGWSLYSLIKNLDRTRFEPHVVVPSSGIFGELYRGLRVPLTEIRSLPERMESPASAPRRVIGLALAAREVAALAQSGEFDLIYCNNMLTKPVGWLAGGSARRPVVFHCRNIHDTRARATFYPMLARSPRVKKVICNSEASREPYARWVGGKTVVIHNGVDLDRFSAQNASGAVRSALKLERSAPLVGYFGNLIPRKGPQILVESAPHVLRRQRDAQFVLVGDEPVGGSGRFRQRLADRVRQLGVESAVHFTGAVPDIRPYLSEVNVAAIPSLQEPFGRVVIEAMAMGVPVVATAVGGIPEIIHDGEDGVLVPPGAPLEFAEGILKLLDDPALAGRIARAASDHVRKNFAAPVMARRIESVLDPV
ncbi:MAG: glycosyltransferase family 4 protein [Nitrospirae bacterium]|nr:glycosyltransferase family 4 protein [Nitrospirota bacterium]